MNKYRIKRDIQLTYEFVMLPPHLWAISGWRTIMLKISTALPSIELCKRWRKFSKLKKKSPVSGSCCLIWKLNREERSFTGSHRLCTYITWSAAILILWNKRSHLRDNHLHLFEELCYETPLNLHREGTLRNTYTKRLFNKPQSCTTCTLQHKTLY